ncbi:MAG TPA: pentapeptide repeat-containing protein [Thermoleophilaceae bacterium]|nr:pentapeptide repeat-containing protein [Thermoleophilaceae bacterium]
MSPVSTAQRCGAELGSCVARALPGKIHCLRHSEDPGAVELTSLDVGLGGHFEHVGLSAAQVTALLPILEDPERTVSVRGSTFLERLTLSGVAVKASVAFDGAVFRLGASFQRCTFEALARFRGVHFQARTRFEECAFIGQASFYHATFDADSGFDLSTFSDPFATFELATFGDRGSFYRTQFDCNDVRFTGVSFGEDLSFEGMVVQGDIRFDDAVFAGTANFHDVTVRGGCSFKRAAFAGPMRFTRSSFAGLADFAESSFQATASFSHSEIGVLDLTTATCEGCCRIDDAAVGGVKAVGANFCDGLIADGASFRHADFSRATFGADVQMREVELGARSSFSDADFAGRWDLSSASVGEKSELCDVRVAGHAHFELARVASGATVRGRFGSLDLTHADFGSRSSLCAEAANIYYRSVTFDDSLEVRVAGRVWLDRSLITVPLTIVAIPGRQARIASLEHTALEAPLVLGEDVTLIECRFRGATGLANLRLQAGEAHFARVRRRAVLAEEIEWRVGHVKGRRARAWRARLGRDGIIGDASGCPEASDLRAVYRQLRASLEDSHDPPGAADFYYGEMEMRRRGSADLLERALLYTYWITSGYGLKAWRSLTAYLVVVSSAAVAFHCFAASLTIAAACDADTTCKALHTSLPASFALSTQATLTFLRAHDVEGLTVGGSFILLFLRVSGPVFLAMIILALRSKVQRA